MRNIAIIPARGGSKRFPNKNVQLLNDFPLIVHSILYAQHNSNVIDEIYVTTDSKEIKEIALEYGVKVINRPNDLSQDSSTTVSALKHVMQNIGGEIDNVIVLQPTNPLRPKKLLLEAYNKYQSGKYDSLMTVSKSDRKLGKIMNDKFVPFNYTMGQRSQDMEPLYYENGLLYISKASLILNNSILGDNNCPMIMEHPFASVDIDTEADLKYAQFILENYSNE